MDFVQRKKIKKAIYFSPLGRIISAFQHLVAWFKRPIMVYGYKNKVTGRFIKNVRISSSAVILRDDHLNIDDNVWVWHNSIIDATSGITIGKGCQIGANVSIFTHSSSSAIRLMGEDYIKYMTKDRIGYVFKPVEIGEYTFLSTGTSVMPGVKIGKGCVVGSNSVVTKDIPDFSIAVGAPAKVIKSVLADDVTYFKDPRVLEMYFDKGIVEKYNKGEL